MNFRSRKSILILIILLCMACIKWIPSQSACAGLYQRQGEGPDQKITINTKDKPISEVLKLMAEQTGYELEMAPCKEKSDVVSVSFTNVDLKEALQRLFKDYNFAFIFHADQKKISIQTYQSIITGAIKDNITASESSLSPPTDFESNNILRTDEDITTIEVIPPEHPGERGTTAEELELYLAEQITPNEGDIEVIPPDEEGQKGMTASELERELSTYEIIPEGDIEVIPPEGNEQKGITATELENQLKNYKKIPEDEIEIFPPEDLNHK